MCFELVFHPRILPFDLNHYRRINVPKHVLSFECKRLLMHTSCHVILVNGGYGDWSDWSNCDCDDTEETRSRSCNNPPPINDGLTCAEQNLGDDTETRSCTTTAETCNSDDDDDNSAQRE